MSTPAAIIIGIIIGYAIALLRQGYGGQAKITSKKSHLQPSGGQDQSTPKEKEIEERTQKIITYIREKGEVSNDDIQALLGIADSTATKYLQQLEDKKLITQVGEQGRHVKYRLS